MAPNKKPRRRNSRSRSRQGVHISEAGLYAIARGFLRIEQGGRLAQDVVRAKLLGDNDIFNQPGSEWEPLGHRLRGVFASLVANGVVEPDGIGALVAADAERRPEVSGVVIATGGNSWLGNAALVGGGAATGAGAVALWQKYGPAIIEMMKDDDDDDDDEDNDDGDEGPADEDDDDAE